MRAARRAAVMAGGSRYDGPTEWLFTADGAFTVPVSGTYEVEMHGGGGAGGGTVEIPMAGGTPFLKYGASGGGSGELYTLQLAKDEEYGITIGMGGVIPIFGNYGTTGGSTTFASYILPGGGGGTRGNIQQTGGAGSGSIASDGCFLGDKEIAPGGLGNIHKPEQTYGNGGYSGVEGNPGAVIVKLVSY